MCWRGFPGWSASGKLRTSADPFVIALARVEQMHIVTDEKPTGSSNDRISLTFAWPLGMPPCMGLLELIRAEQWVM